MSEDIKQGDTVLVKGLRHSSRCPHMVVMGLVVGGRVSTFWFDRKFRLQTAVFLVTELERVDLQ